MSGRGHIYKFTVQFNNYQVSTINKTGKSGFTCIAEATSEANP